MKTRLLVGLLVGGLMAVMLPGLAAAGPPEREAVTITSPMEILYPLPNEGTFTATGSLLCSQGTVVDTHLDLIPLDKPTKHVYVEKTFTCADPSHAFYVQLHAIPRKDGTEKLSWRIVGGTGDYVGLKGQGVGYSDAQVGEVVVNHYTGRVMLEDS